MVCFGRKRWKRNGVPRWAAHPGQHAVGALGDQRLRHRLHRRAAPVFLPGPLHAPRHGGRHLVPSAGLLTLSAASVGRVMRVDVHEGQHVARG